MVTKSAHLVVLTALLACSACKPSKEEIDQLVDQRLTERGLMPASSASGSAAPAASASSAPTGATKTTDDPAAASLAFLAKLDELMKNYTAPVAADEDKSDVLRCITSDTVKNSPDLQKVAATLKKRADTSKQDRARRQAEFYKTLFPLAFHYDLDWPTRKGPAVPPTHRCWGIGSFGYGLWFEEFKTETDCLRGGSAFGGSPFEWRVTSPGHPAQFLYSGSDVAPTQPPELMRRMETANIKPLARFSCRVDDVTADQERKTVKCVSSGTGPALRVSGQSKAINAGDLVSVPVAGTKRDPDGVLFKNFGDKNVAGWVVDADGAALTVDAAATCPSTADILAAVGGK